MPTSPPNRIQARKLKELDERTARAWGAYRDSLRELAGRDYDDAEDRSWELLQPRCRSSTPSAPRSSAAAVRAHSAEH